MTPQLTQTLFILAIACSTSVLRAQWVEFTDETSSRVIVSSVPQGDAEEKDMEAADFDQDGDLDVVVVRKRPFSEVGARDDVLFMNENGVLVDRTAQFGFNAGDSDARDVLSVDVNGDGWLDVVICTTFEDPLRLYMNRGDDINGDWLGFSDESSPRLGTVNEPSRKYCAVGAGDVNGDRAPDLFFSNYNGGDDLLYINDGAGNFVDETQARMGSYANSAFGTSNVIIDIDGDGDRDIIKLTTLFDAAPFTRGIYVLWNDGTGDFNNIPFQHINPDRPYMFILEDFSGDGMLDMYVVGDLTDVLYTSNGATPDTNWSLSPTPISGALRTEQFGGNLRAADLDGDGDVDLGVGPIDTDIANCGKSNRLALLRNDSGVLSDPYNGMAAQNFNIEPHDLVYIDLNEDGCMDMFMGLCGGYRVLMGTGCGASPCGQADLAEPYGELNFFDLGEFLTRFNAQDPSVDFAAPIGVFNFFDLGEFLNLFNQGCP